jgi:hypothetical protein
MHYFYYLKLFTIYHFDTLQIVFSFLKFTRHVSALASRRNMSGKF